MRQGLGWWGCYCKIKNENMKDSRLIELNTYDSEDIDDVLIKIKKSFGLKFERNEFAHVKTFGDIYDVISAKIKGEDVLDCTTQQAFYKLKEAIHQVRGNEIQIFPTTRLDSLFPKKDRKPALRRIENDLGQRLNILGPKNYIKVIIFILIIASLVEFFFNWKYALYGLGFSVAAGKVAGWLGKEFEVKTIEDVVKKMVTGNYRKSRRHPATVNRKEIDGLVMALFNDAFGFE